MKFDFLGLVLHCFLVTDSFSAVSVICFVMFGLFFIAVLAVVDQDSVCFSQVSFLHDVIVESFILQCSSY